MLFSPSLRTLLLAAAVLGTAAPAMALTRVSFNSGSIRVRGDAAPDRLRIVANEHDVQITALGGTFRFQGQDVSSATLPVRDKLSVSTAGGGDRIQLRSTVPAFIGGVNVSVYGTDPTQNLVLVEGADLAGNLTITAGLSNDFFALTDAAVAGNTNLFLTQSAGGIVDIAGGSFGGRLQVIGGAGPDSFTVREGDGPTFIGDQLRLDTRGGDDRARVRDAIVTRTVVSTAGGNDSVGFEASALLNPAYISTGGGADTIVFSGNAEGQFNQTFDTVYVDAGAGGDTLDIQESFFGSFTQIDLGTGRNFAAIDDSRFDGRLRLRNRGERGSLAIEEELAFGGTTQFRSNFEYVCYAGGQFADVALGGSATFFRDAYFFADTAAGPNLLLLGDAEFLRELTTIGWNVEDFAGEDSFGDLLAFD